MLSVFILSFLAAVLISGFCSLMEASLYAVPEPYVNTLASDCKKTGQILKHFKDNMSRPISAILILNTIANTAGASVCGWAAGEVFGSQFLAVFSIIFTLIILYCSEIIPKMVGVIYCKQIAPLIAYPLLIILKLEAPLVAFSDGLSRIIQGKREQPGLSINELLAMAELGLSEGALDELEGSVIRNIIKLDNVLVKDILTPRVVVFRLMEDMRILDLKDKICDWHYSRVPVFSEDKEDLLTGYVTQRDVYQELIKSKADKKLKDIARPLNTIPELMKADKLLMQFVENREHISAVVDEHGSLVGIITLEDVLEEIVGKEIVDEYDAVRDLRKYARNKLKKKLP